MAVSESTAPLIGGFIGGVVSTSLLLPLDVLKVRLQVNESSSSSPHGRRQRLGALRVVRGIVKYEGLRGLWVGWTPAVIGSAVSWGGYFFFYEKLKKAMVDYRLRALPDQSDVDRTPSEVLSSLDNFGLACLAGAVMVACTNPIWLVKTRIQLQMKKASQQYNIKPYDNMLDAVRTILREEGPLALYRGAGPALLLTSHGGVQFVVYEYLRRHFHYQRSTRTSTRSLDGNKEFTSVVERLELSAGYLAIGAASKIVASTCTYPLQVIKARMQQRSDSLEFTSDGEIRAVKRQYTGMLQTGRRMLEKEGLFGFFKGCIPNALRVAPGAAITFVTYESVMDFFRPEM